MEGVLHTTSLLKASLDNCLRIWKLSRLNYWFLYQSDGVINKAFDSTINFIHVTVLSLPFPTIQTIITKDLNFMMFYCASTIGMITFKDSMSHSCYQVLYAKQCVILYIPILAKLDRSEIFIKAHRFPSNTPRIHFVLTTSRVSLNKKLYTYRHSLWNSTNNSPHKGRPSRWRFQTTFLLFTFRWRIMATSMIDY